MPQKIEAEIDNIISDIRRLRREVSDLNGAALSMARRNAERDLQHAQQDLVAASDREDQDAAEIAFQKLAKSTSKPKEDWADILALHHLDLFERGLKVVAGRAIAESGATTGRPRNQVRITWHCRPHEFSTDSRKQNQHIGTAGLRHLAGC